MRSTAIASFLLLAAAAVDGRTLYETKCAQCHGKDGVAKPPGKGSRNFNDPAFQASSDDEAIAAITAEGKGKMPGYRSKLSAEQIRAVSAHVKTLGSSPR
jgi:mono/diheme cytochrome c family protein